MKKLPQWQATAVRPRATGVGLRLRTTQQRLGLGSSPDKAIVIPEDPPASLTVTTPMVQDTKTQEGGPRRSLRVITQGEPASTMTKAVKRKGVNHATPAGIPLINNFPYSRLTLDQIDALFQVYQINLGDTVEDRQLMIAMIQTIDRPQFELAIKTFMARDRTQPLKEFLVQFRLQFGTASDKLVSL